VFNRQHSLETEIFAPGGIRTRNPSKGAALDPHLVPCSHGTGFKRVIIFINWFQSSAVRKKTILQTPHL